MPLIPLLAKRPQTSHAIRADESKRSGATPVPDSGVARNWREATDKMARLIEGAWSHYRIWRYSRLQQRGPEENADRRFITTDWRTSFLSQDAGFGLCSRSESTGAPPKRFRQD